jgi:Zn-dependent protease with chaperone function
MQDFPVQQERALSRSAQLVGLLIVAVSGTVVVTAAVLTYLLVVLLVSMSLDLSRFQWQLAEIFGVFCAVAAVLIGVSSLNKMKQLRAGGRVIAEDLGGTLLEPSSSNRRHRRALNVVEEMAVASGIKPPAVYLLPNQPGINAFAAGLTVDDAVIGLTQGCLERLNRQQLQGVIGHEFSHIFNGDMRLNLRLVGMLHGLLGISLFAEALLQSAHELSTEASEHRDPLGETGLAAVMLIAGAMLWPVGLVGTLFGMLVMSATSRQREYLADAYAVQFTRDPTGLADALKVLAGCDAGSRVRCSHTLEVSHLLFAPGNRWMAGLLATHPPLAERIRRLDPQWDGIPLFEDIDEEVDSTTDSSSAAENAADSAGSFVAQVLPLAGTGAGVLRLVTGDRGTEQRTSSTLPEASMFCTSERSSSELESCQSLDPDACWAIVLNSWSRHDEHEQLMAFDQAVSQLEAWPSAARRLEQRLLQLLATVTDGDLVHWGMSWQLRRRLRFCLPPKVRPSYGKLADLQPACEVLLSAICHAGSAHDAMAQYAFQRAVTELPLKDPQFWLRDELTCERLDAAAQLAAELAPRPQRQLFDGVLRSLTADQGISLAELHCLRGIGAAMGVPLPTLLPGVALARDR